MQNRKTKASKNENATLIICCVAVLVMLVSYVAALAQFADNKIYEPPKASEETDAPSDEPMHQPGEEVSQNEEVIDYKY